MPAPENRGPRRAAFALAGLLAMAAGAAGVAWLLHPAPAHPPQGTGPVAIGAPALQAAPQPDLAAYQAEKQAALARVGPDPRAPGFAHIPVDRAMALMTERGMRADASPRKEGP